MTQPISFPAPAKINLFLHLTGKRDDGYHLLESLIAFADVVDRVTAEPADALTLTITGPFAEGLEAGADNLVLRAANALAALADVAPRARLTLEKNLPVASGIGGGSADAAATLAALCHLWEITPRRDDLMTLALSLGADVPICLAGHAAMVSGIGEIISPPVTLPDAWLVLANPRVAVSTADVFKARTAPFSEPGAIDDMPNDVIAGLETRQNDLAAPAAALAPEINDVITALDALTGARLVRLSGSGATAFAIFDSQAEADRGRAVLSERHPGWWIAAAALLDRTELADAQYLVRLAVARLAVSD